MKDFPSTNLFFFFFLRLGDNVFFMDSADHSLRCVFHWRNRSAFTETLPRLRQANFAHENHFSVAEILSLSQKILGGHENLVSLAEKGSR